ncbi:thermonuclease family protein [Bacillus methanolicus]|uniref:thermonuclease family protein n=1 Tax=Bacillus methanolicus TaxID=1471 RepID=UPI00200E1D0E|nr:thermonuclease family protein [Bacillus methanolicus]
MKKLKGLLFITAAFLIMSIFPSQSEAHRGALDKLGGHFRNSDCAYLLHKPTSLAKTAKTKSQLLTLIKKYSSNSCKNKLTVNKIYLEGGYKLPTGTAPKPAQKPAPKPTTKKVALPTIRINSKHTVKVIRVVDGDTVEVRFSNGATAKVRLIGVNTPETVHPNKPVEKYGKEASNYTKKRLTNKTVTLEFDVQIKDKYGRLLAYVWIGKELYNETLVKEGYAHVMTIQPNVKYQKRFLAAERAARKAKKGLWK